MGSVLSVSTVLVHIYECQHRRNVCRKRVGHEGSSCKSCTCGAMGIPIFEMDRKPRDVGTKSIAIEVGAGLLLLNESLQV